MYYMKRICCKWFRARFQVAVPHILSSGYGNSMNSRQGRRGTPRLYILDMRKTQFVELTTLYYIYVCTRERGWKAHGFALMGKLDFKISYFARQNNLFCEAKQVKSRSKITCFPMGEWFAANVAILHLLPNVINWLYWQLWSGRRRAWGLTWYFALFCVKIEKKQWFSFYVSKLLPIFAHTEQTNLSDITNLIK